jgi:hypothetical protein
MSELAATPHMQGSKPTTVDSRHDHHNGIMTPVPSITSHIDRISNQVVKLDVWCCCLTHEFGKPVVQSNPFINCMSCSMCHGQGREQSPGAYS